MKLSKKKNDRLEIRLSEEDKLLFMYVSAFYGKTPTRYLRMLIDSVILPQKNKIIRGDLSYEDVKAFLDNQLQFRGVFGK
ncbi:MAG: hypothetical protein IJX30_03515 [Clostridia bacterium]|nr:hypothetical protein [Clostridia bacterium]